MDSTAAEELVSSPPPFLEGRKLLTWEQSV